MAHVKIYSSDYCPYCHRAKALLRARGVTEWEEINVDGRPEVRR
ncbi:MAG: glutaredoxin 3, partial [Tepidimonas sp.]|nr:glutaredoxin 3 [Tepidimonas sp.]